MLILTRRTDERVLIGDDVQVTVLGVKGNQVRIGIAAPESVHIVREELLPLNPDRSVTLPATALQQVRA